MATPAIQQPTFEGLLSRGDLGVWIGRDKDKKFDLILQFAIAAASGSDFLHFRFAAERPLKVVMLDYRSKTDVLKTSYDAIVQAMPLSGDQRARLDANLHIHELRKARSSGSGILPYFPVKPKTRKGHDDEFEASDKRWREFIAGCGADLYIFHPMRLMHTEDENDSSIAQFLSCLVEVCRGKTIIVSHEPRKVSRVDYVPLEENMRLWADSSRGSGAIIEHADVVICQERVEEDGEEIVYMGSFSNNEADAGPFRLIPSEHYRQVAPTPPPEHLRKTLDKLRSTCERAENPECFESYGDAAKWLHENAGVKKSTAYRHVQRGLLIQLGGIWFTA